MTGGGPGGTALGPPISHTGLVQGLRRRTRELLEELTNPTLLLVTNSPLTDAMAMPQPGPHFELGDDFDWLLAAGRERLGVIRLPSARLTRCDLVIARPYNDIDIEWSDDGLLDRRRAIVVTLEDGSWFALGCRLTPRKQPAVDAFTAAVQQRCRT